MLLRTASNFPFFHLRLPRSRRLRQHSLKCVLLFLDRQLWLTCVSIHTYMKMPTKTRRCWVPWSCSQTDVSAGNPTQVLCKQKLLTIATCPVPTDTVSCTQAHILMSQSIQIIALVYLTGSDQSFSRFQHGSVYRQFAPYNSLSLQPNLASKFSTILA